MRIKQIGSLLLAPLLVFAFLTTITLLVNNSPKVSAAVCDPTSATSIQDSITCGVDKTGAPKTCTAADGTTASGNACVNASANSIVTNVVNVLSLVVGIIAVVMIIVAGLMFVTAGGDTTRIGKARATILYAVVGLVVVALAQVIVRFVLNNATGNAKSTTPPTSNPVGIPHQ